MVIKGVWGVKIWLLGEGILALSQLYDHALLVRGGRTQRVPHTTAAAILCSVWLSDWIPPPQGNTPIQSERGESPYARGEFPQIQSANFCGNEDLLWRAGDTPHSKVRAPFFEAERLPAEEGSLSGHGDFSLDGKGPFLAEGQSPIADVGSPLAEGNFPHAKRLPPLASRGSSRTGKNFPLGPWETAHSVKDFAIWQGNEEIVTGNQTRSSHGAGEQLETLSLSEVPAPLVQQGATLAPSWIWKTPCEAQEEGKTESESGVQVRDDKEKERGGSLHSKGDIPPSRPALLDSLAPWLPAWSSRVTVKPIIVSKMYKKDDQGWEQGAYFGDVNRRKYGVNVDEETYVDECVKVPLPRSAPPYGRSQSEIEHTLKMLKSVAGDGLISQAQCEVCINNARAGEWGLLARNLETFQEVSKLQQELIAKQVCPILCAFLISFGGAVHDSTVQEERTAVLTLLTPLLVSSCGAVFDPTGQEERSEMLFEPTFNFMSLIQTACTAFAPIRRENTSSSKCVPPEYWISAGTGLSPTRCEDFY